MVRVEMFACFLMARNITWLSKYATGVEKSKFKDINVVFGLERIISHEMAVI